MGHRLSPAVVFLDIPIYSATQGGIRPSESGVAQHPAFSGYSVFIQARTL